MRILITAFVGTLALLCSASFSAATPPTYHWSKALVGPDWDRVTDIAVDASGNIFVIGYFQNTLDVCGSQLVSAGGYDGFLAKYSSKGELVWSFAIGGTDGFDYARAVAVDASGNVLVTGQFGDTVDFGGGGIVSNGLGDIYVVKYDNDGVHQWSKGLGAGAGDAGSDVAVDASGNVYVTGEFYQTVDFGGGPLVADARDAFLVKYDASGGHLWSQHFGEGGGDTGRRVAIDLLNSVVMAGTFSDSISLGGSTYHSAGSADIFVSQFNTNGTFGWARAFGGVDVDQVNGLGVDLIDVYVSGSFAGSADFGGGAIASAGYSDIYIAKYDLIAGTHQWSQGIGSTGNEYSDALALDKSNNRVIIGGGFSIDLDFGGGPLTSAGNFDAYLAAFDDNATHLWSQSFGDTLQDRTWAVATDGQHVIAGGELFGSIDLGGGPHYSVDQADIFLGRFVAEGLEPVIYAITDVGNDQGREVQVSFLRSTEDDADGDPPILNYEVYRQDDANGSSPVFVGGHDVGRPMAVEGWTYVGSAPAHGDASYSLLAPTVGDSTISMGDYLSTFFVRAATGVPTTFYDSDPCFGYSLDNLAPPMPTSFAYNAGIVSWG